MEINMTRKRIISGKEITLNMVNGWNDPRTQEVSAKLLTHIINTNGKTIRYRELANLLDFECPAHIVDHFLGALSYTCLESGLPPVSVMVVNEKFLPGDGFFKAYYPSAKNETDRIAIALEQMKRVREYKHWDIILDIFTGIGAA